MHQNPRSCRCVSSGSEWPLRAYHSLLFKITQLCFVQLSRPVFSSVVSVSSREILEKIFAGPATKKCIFAGPSRPGRTVEQFSLSLVPLPPAHSRGPSLHLTPKLGRPEPRFWGRIEYLINFRKKTQKNHPAALRASGQKSKCSFMLINTDIKLYV